jgi:hypothetical protein
MSKEIEAVKIRVEDIEHEGKIEVNEWGLEVKEQLTTKDWLDAVLSLQKFDGKVQWYLGDLVVYAQSDLVGWDTEPQDGGDSGYKKLVKATGYDYGTLRVYASVARRFSSLFRETLLSQDNTNTLGFHHFRMVAPLEDNFAVYWLQKASENGWGKDKLGEEIRKWKEERGEIAEKEEAPIGYTSFKRFTKEFFDGWVPNLSKEEYDEKSWLLEVHDTIEQRLHDLGIEL